MMQRTRGTRALMDLEDLGPDVLFETVPGSDIHVWPLLRWLVSRSMAERELGAVAVARPGSPRAAALRAARQLVPHRFASARLRTKVDSLFVVNGGTISQRAGGTRNWLVDEFAESLGTTAVVLQDRPLDGFLRPAERPTFPRTYSFEDATVRIEAASRLFGPSTEEASSLRAIVREVYRHLDFAVAEDRIRATQRQLLARAGRARHSRDAFQRLVDRIDPRVVFMQGAAYGDRSHLIRLLKSRGVHVAEHQHGWIGPSHGAYNHGRAMSSSPLSESLPDTLLTFGEFWTDGVSWPFETVAIGKPHLEALTRDLSPLADRPATVMVVSSVVDRDELSATTLALRDALPADWQVSLRPHPSERARVAELYPLLDGQDRVSFDLGTDVYESLRQSRGVVGLASTVLYEALAFGCPVAVKDSSLADYYIDDSIFGERIVDDASLRRTAERFVSSENAGTGKGRGPIDSVWKPNAVSNFQNYVQTLR